MLALLTGVPGVGKSTIASLITARHPERTATVSFGKLLYEAVRERAEAQLEYTEFRRKAAGLVQPTDIAVATERIVTSPHGAHSRAWLLVDSHAIAKASFGWQANPDTPTVLRRFDYKQIIHLTAPPDAVLTRVGPDTAGRLAATERDISTMESVQISISSYYAGTLSCPLRIIDASGEPDDVADLVEEALGL